MQCKQESDIWDTPTPAHGINLPLWFTKQQNLGIGLQEVNRPSLIQVVSSSFIPPHPPPPLYSCSPQSSCIPTVSVWCMWLFKLKTITFFTAITVWKCKSRTTSRGMIHYKISKAAAASAKTNNIFGLMMEPVFFWRFSALKNSWVAIAANYRHISCCRFSPPFLGGEKLQPEICLRSQARDAT